MVLSLELMVYTLAWVLQMIGTLFSGMLYGMALVIVFIVREMWGIIKFTHLAKFLKPIFSKINTVLNRGLLIFTNKILVPFLKKRHIVYKQTKRALEILIGSRFIQFPENSKKIRETLKTFFREFSIFWLWLRHPAHRLFFDHKDPEFSAKHSWISSLKPVIGYRDFKVLSREPRHALVRKLVATWVLFFVVLSTTGVASFLPSFDWLFGEPEVSQAATFTGDVKVSFESTTLSTAGDWRKAMAYSGDGVNGDGDYISPLLSSQTDTVNGLAYGMTSIVGLVGTMNNYDGVSYQFIPWQPATDGDINGVILSFVYNQSSFLNANLVLELLRFPTASYSGGWTNYVSCSAIGTCSYPSDTVIERSTVMRWDEIATGQDESASPEQFGNQLIDFRFDPPLAVTTTEHYGFRFYTNNSNVAASWPRGTATKPQLNATNFGLGIRDIDLTDASTVAIPLANTTTASSAMVALNSIPSVGAAVGARTENEHWTGAYAGGVWTLTGTESGAQTRTFTSATTGGTGASWVDDGAKMTTLTADSTASTLLCVASIAGFDVNDYIDIWDSDSASIQRIIQSTSGADGSCSGGPSITVSATLLSTDNYTTLKNATVAEAKWKLRIVQGADVAITEVLGLTTFCVADSSNFSVDADNNNINIYDDLTAVGARRISAIDPNTGCTSPTDDRITVSASLAGAYTVADHAHMVEISANFSNSGTPSGGNTFRFASVNMLQNPTRVSSSYAYLRYGKTIGPAASAARYPYLANLRHPFYIAYGDDGINAAPLDGDLVIIGGGAADPDVNDSTNLNNDLLLANISPHTVEVDKDFDMPLVYTGNTGSGLGDGTVVPAASSLGSASTSTPYSGGTGFLSMLLTTRSILGVDDSANKHYSLTLPGKLVLSAGAELQLGNSTNPLPNTSTVDIYEDVSGPTVSTTLTVNSSTNTYIDVTSTTGFFIGDVVMIADVDSAPITRIIAAVTSSTRLTFTAAMVAGYTTPTATVSRGPNTTIPTGVLWRGMIVGANSAAGRSGVTSYGSDSFRTTTADLAVDIDGSIDTGNLTTQQAVSGNTYFDVSPATLAGDWSALDPVSVAQGTQGAVNNADSSVGMGANDDANGFPVWTGQTTVGMQDATTLNAELAEIGTVPFTNIYNADKDGGDPADPNDAIFSSNYATSNSWTIFSDNANTEVEDAVYFGDQGSTPIYALEMNFGTAMTSSTTRVWEYWNGSAWTAFSPQTAWKYTPRGNTTIGGLGYYCVPLSVDPAAFPTTTVTLTDANSYFFAGQWVKITDNNSPTIIRRIASVTVASGAVAFTEMIPDGYTTSQSAKVCLTNGGEWTHMDASDLYTQTGRTLLSWNDWDTPNVAKTTINGVSAYWIRNRISAFTSWTTSPVTQTSPVAMQGVATVNATPLYVSDNVNEAQLSELSTGASFDPNETWVLRYNDNSTSDGTLDDNRWHETQTASYGTAHRWTSPNPDGETSGYYEKNAQDAGWATMNGDFSRTDSSVYAKVYWNQPAIATAGRRLGIALRHDADQNGFALLVTKTTTTATLGWFTEALGTETAIGSATNITFDVNKWYCLRAEAIGTQLQAKFWSPVSEDANCKGDANEPGLWTESEPSPAFTSGRFGLIADTILARFDDVTEVSTDGLTTYFTDSFDETGCWNVIGSVHGSLGCAYNDVPFTSSYLNFTIKHKGGVQGGETGAQVISGPVNTPEQGDSIYLSPIMRGSNIGLDETAGITVSNTATKYENWDFTYNAAAGKWDVKGSQYGVASTQAIPGTTYTTPGGEISLKIKAGTPAGPKFGTGAAYFQNSFNRSIGNFTGLNTQNSALLIAPYWTYTGSVTNYNIEGQSGTAAQTGTIDFWFKPNFSGSPKAPQYLFDYCANLTTDRILVRIMPNGTIEANVEPLRGAYKLSKAFTATAGQWYHFRLAWGDSDAGNINKQYAFLDGEPFTSNQGTTLGARAATTGYIRLGNSWKYTEGFDGAIDEFAIFNDAVDVSAGDNWGSFTPPAISWTGGETVGTGLNTGVNTFVAHFNTAMDPQKGFVWADYALGIPTIAFTNGADVLTNDRIRVTTYPAATRIFVDNTGSQYSPSARIKNTEGYGAAESGWGIGFQYHHRAASTNADTPITSKVLNLRRQIRLFSGEDAVAAGNTTPVNETIGMFLYYPKNIDINHMELRDLYQGIINNGNSMSGSSPTQYFRKSSLSNIFSYGVYVASRTLGLFIADENNYFSNGRNAISFCGASSSNITVSDSYFMGYSSASYSNVWFAGGRLLTLSGNTFLNASSVPFYISAGTSKITISNNEFWRYYRAISFNGNAYVTMSDNTYDGGSVNSASTYATGIYIAPGTTNVFFTDSGSTFGDSIWNEVDMSLTQNATTYLAGSLFQYTGEDVEFYSPVNYLGTVSQDAIDLQYVQTAIPGVDVRNAIGVDIRNYSNYGNMEATCATCDDTTVRTDGGFGWRLESTSETDPFEYAADIVGVAGKPLAVTGYLQLNSTYGTSTLPTVVLSGLGMTGTGLTWTASATPGTWQQFTVSGTPTESALATLTITVQSTPVNTETGTAENIDDGMGSHLPTTLEDTDKTWTSNQRAGYRLRDSSNFIFNIIGNTSTRLFLEGLRLPFGDVLATQPYGGDYEIYLPPYVYLDDISVLSGTVDTGTLDFFSDAQPVSPFLNTGLTAEGVWSAQSSSFADVTGSFGQILNSLMSDYGAVNDSGATTTIFKTDLAKATADFYNEGVLIFTSGSNNGQVRRITDYDGPTRQITVSPALSSAPVSGDDFAILSQIASSPLEASSVWAYASRTLSSATLDAGSLATLANLTSTQSSLSGDITAAESSLSGDITAAESSLSGDITAAETSLSGDIAAAQSALSGNITSTETTLNTAITSTQKIAVGTILNSETTVKSGDALSILFRADSGLTGGNLPVVNAWDPAGAQVVTNAAMTELGTTGVYQYALTFTSGWGIGQFTVQATESTNSTKDSVSILVTATDLASLSSTVSLLANDLISVRATVSDATITPTINAFETNLVTAVDNYYNNALLTFTSGANVGIARRIEDYDSTTKVITVEPDLAAIPASGDTFTILRETAVPITAINTLDTNLDTVMADIAIIKARLDSVDSSISALQNKVETSVTHVYNVSPSDMFSELGDIASEMYSINETLEGLDTSTMAELMAISESNTDDLEYIKNKIADLQAVSTLEREIITNPDEPIVQTWYTEGSLDINILVTNPASTTEKVPVKVYLPKETKMEHIIDDDGMEIQYDVTLGMLYASGEYELGPGESLKKVVRVQDIWSISEEELASASREAENLYEKIADTQYGSQALLVKNDIDSRIAEITRIQSDSTTAMDDKIMAYRENFESFTIIEADIAQLENLVSENAVSYGFLGAIGGIQTMSVWGIVIVIVTGFGLLTFILFSMWRHQMRLAGGQLALQMQAMGGKKANQLLFQQMAYGTPAGVIEGKVSRRKKKEEPSEPVAFHFSEFVSYAIKRFKKWFRLHQKGLVILTVSAIGLVLVSGTVALVLVFAPSISSRLFPQDEVIEESMVIPEEAAPSADEEVIDSTAVVTDDVVADETLTRVQVLSTPTGWLNVRAEPSTEATILTTVLPGEIYQYLLFQEQIGEEEYGWYQIILSEGSYGWVYEEYVEVVDETAESIE
ncbi:MAG: SH3 domain-containing protein [Patescibacteria group bacterium]